MFFSTLYWCSSKTSHDCMKDPRVIEMQKELILKDSCWKHCNGQILQVKRDPLWQHYKDNSNDYKSVMK